MIRFNYKSNHTMLLPVLSLFTFSLLTLPFSTTIQNTIKPPPSRNQRQRRLIPRRRHCRAVNSRRRGPRLPYSPPCLPCFLSSSCGQLLASHHLQPQSPVPPRCPVSLQAPMTPVAVSPPPFVLPPENATGCPLLRLLCFADDPTAAGRRQHFSLAAACRWLVCTIAGSRHHPTSSSSGLMK